MDKWEYKIVDVRQFGAQVKQLVPRFAAQQGVAEHDSWGAVETVWGPPFNALGAEGWELVLNNNGSLWVFKRRRG